VLLKNFTIGEDNPVPPEAYREITPWALTEFDLDPDHALWGRNDPGFYLVTVEISRT
jgi:hypothetical protein